MPIKSYSVCISKQNIISSLWIVYSRRHIKVILDIMGEKASASMNARHDKRLNMLRAKCTFPSIK